MASAPISTADFSNRPNGWMPTPMIATELDAAVVMVGSPLNRLEREGDDLVAVGIGREWNHRQLDLHAERQLRRIVLGQPTLDPHHVTKLHQTHAERHEVLARRTYVGRTGRKALRRPRDDRPAPRQQNVAHVGLAALGTV